MGCSSLAKKVLSASELYSYKKFKSFRLDAVSSTFAISAISLAVVSACALPQPVSAATVIKTSGPDFIFGSGPDSSDSIQTFTEGGFSITFFNPQSPNTFTVSRTVDGLGKFGTIPGGGTCLGGSRISEIKRVCGNSIPPSLPPQLNSIQVKTNKDLFVTAFSIIARTDIRDGTGVNTVTSTLSNGLGTIGSLSFSVQAGVDTQQMSGNYYTRTYDETFSPFLVSASSPLTISSTFAGSIDYWVSSVTVEEVPGPLPALGAAAAFCWSRKIRRKLKGCQDISKKSPSL